MIESIEVENTPISEQVIQVILKELESDQQADSSANEKVHIEINNLEFDFEKMKQLPCHYIFSTVEI